MLLAAYYRHFASQTHQLAEVIIKPACTNRFLTMFNLNQPHMKKSNVLIVLMHLIYWFPGFMSLFYSQGSGAGLDYNIYYFNYTTAYVLSLIVFYIFYLVLFPRFLYKPQLLKFITWSFLTLVAALAMAALFVTVYVRYYYSPITVNFVIGGGNSMIILVKTISAAVAACIMRGFITWFTEINYKEQLEKRNVAAKLELLKAKINPHFLFNTLNNIDVLIEKDAATASVYLKKLSDILRFTLYESPADAIPLKKELDYITQYIELQKIRTSNPNFVSFDFGGVVDNVHVAPMLFIPFIENAFKYSTNKKIDNGIEITIGTSTNTIVFTCSNVYDQKEQITGEGGLGLNIMEERLQLLYPGRHHLEIDKTTDRFTVTLTITLYGN